MEPPTKILKKGGRSLRNLNARKALRVVVTNSQNKENGQGPVACYSTKVNTGMEKDEEKELHLQVAIQTQKASLNGHLSSASSIPIPKVDHVDPADYSRYRIRPTRIRNDRKWIQAVPEDAYCMRIDTYEMDEEDEKFLRLEAENMRLSYDEFEDCVGLMERNSKKTVISMAACFVKLPQHSREAVQLIYDYWLRKRLKLCQTTFPSASLVPEVPDEPSYSDKNPYIAFRKRELDIRRRSVRLAFNQALVDSQQHQPRQRNPEMTTIEREEELDRLRNDVFHQSELDGRFLFKRVRQCSYQLATQNELTNSRAKSRVLPPKQVPQQSLVVKTLNDKQPDELNNVSEPKKEIRGSEDLSASTVNLHIGSRTRYLFSAYWTQASASSTSLSSQQTTSDTVLQIPLLADRG